MHSYILFLYTHRNHNHSRESWTADAVVMRPNGERSFEVLALSDRKIVLMIQPLLLVALSRNEEQQTGAEVRAF